MNSNMLNQLTYTQWRNEGLQRKGRFNDGAPLSLVDPDTQPGDHINADIGLEGPNLICFPVSYTYFFVGGAMAGFPSGSMDGDLGGRFPKFEVGDGPCLRPPNISRKYFVS